MGASDYSSISAGKTPEAAFRSAVEQAQWEDGHSGYTGTIAEKQGAGFIMLPALPARWTTQKVEDLISQARYGESYRTANGTYKIRKGSQQKARDLLAEWLFNGGAIHFGGGSRGVDTLLAYADDKWGAALCVEVASSERRAYRIQNSLSRGERVFSFFGTASS